MKVTKFMKGLLAAALAVTMAVTPAASVKAAEVTVTSGASTYTFSEMPVAAFEVTGWQTSPVIFYCLPVGAQVHSQAGSSEWERAELGTEAIMDDGRTSLPQRLPDRYSESEQKGYFGEAHRGYGGPYFRISEIYHSDISGFDAIYVFSNEGSYRGDAFDITTIPEIFAAWGMTAVQIPVEDALARGNNASVQSDTAQQAAEAQAAQQAAEAAAQAEAQAAAQTQITSQQTSVSQGTYIVEAGDNLCKIAQKVYGDMKAWREIYKANAGTVKSDYIIYKGQVLVIPAR